jgi:hypothetical protein
MKIRLSGSLVLIALLSMLFACKQTGKSDSSIGSDSISLEEIEPLIHKIDTSGGGLPIFYNMYLSVEMSSLFDVSGAVFKQDLLNSPDKISDYITSSKKALNLGIYAVDLSYSKVFEQFETAGKYFNAMQKLAEELGIPANYFENTAKRFDRNINDKDSLTAIANEVYMATDNYLRENERYSAAAQVILGGWVEAIHIAVDVVNTTKDLDVIERLAEQRMSLANVIDMIQPYDDDVIIAQNLQKLNQLKPLFDSFVIKTAPNFDASSPEGKKTIQDYLVKVNEIGKKVNQIRSEMTS